MPRREFLKTALAVSAAGVMTACSGDMGGSSSGSSSSSSSSGSSSGNNGKDETVNTPWRIFPQNDGTVEIDGYDGTLDADVVIPEKIGKYPVSILNGFAYRKEIRTLTIPASVKRIETSAFEGCEYLQEIHFSEGLEEIGGCAFQDCTSLRSIELPQSVKSIRGCAFRNCEKARTLSIPSKLTTIKLETFRNIGVEELVIPAAVTAIGGSAFYGFRYLKRVRFLGKPQLEKNVFIFCGNLESIELPDNMEEIPAGLLQGCEALKKLDIPPKVKRIGEGSFMRAGLVEVKLPQSVTQIGKNAFMGMKNIQTIVLPAGVTDIGNGAFAVTSITKMVLPEGLGEIGDDVFSCSRELRSVYIPASVQSIGIDAFQECKLTDVYYGGTREQWNKIKKQKGNDALGSAEFHENASGAALQTAAQFFF